MAIFGKGDLFYQFSAWAGVRKRPQEALKLKVEFGEIPINFQPRFLFGFQKEVKERTFKCPNPRTSFTHFVSSGSKRS